MLPVLILAGGLATRMRPITSTIPKALIMVAGKPFIFHQLEYLHKQGIRDVVISVGYLGDMIESALGDGSVLNMKIKYSYDGPRLLGTGGAIRKALPLLEEDFFVLYGDSFLPINFEAVLDKYEEIAYPALMTVLKNQNEWDVSNVWYENGNLREYNKKNPNKKMHYIDYGLGVVNRTIFSRYQIDQPFDLADLYHQLSLDHNLGGYEVHEHFYEIGSIDGLHKTEEYFKKTNKENI